MPRPPHPAAPIADRVVKWIAAVPARAVQLLGLAPDALPTEARTLPIEMVDAIGDNDDGTGAVAGRRGVE